MSDENKPLPKTDLSEIEISHTQGDLKAKKITIARKLSKKEAANVPVAHYLREYKDTNNPLYLIKARKFARDAGARVPEIIEKWLDESLDDFMYYTGVSLDVTTGLKEEKSGASTALGEYHLKRRDVGTYDIMFSLRNLADHLQVNLNQSDCAHIARAWLDERRESEPDWPKSKASTLESRYSKWKKRPPVRYPQNLKKQILLEFEQSEWARAWSQGNSSCLNTIECHIRSITSYPPTSHSKKNILLNKLKAMREAANLKIARHSNP